MYDILKHRLSLLFLVMLIAHSSCHAFTKSTQKEIHAEAPSLMLSHGEKEKGNALKRIFFNLYTDSIKPVLNYYVNVDGEFNDGTFLPMDTSFITITADQGTMKGNEWIAPKIINFDAVTFTVEAKDNKTLRVTKTVPIKKNWQQDDDVLEMQEVLQQKVIKKRKS